MCLDKDVYENMPPSKREKKFEWLYKMWRAKGLIDVRGYGRLRRSGQPAFSREKAQTDITLVAGGCGVGLHRGPYGYCVRNGYANRRQCGHVHTVTGSIRMAAVFPTTESQ